MQAKERVYHTLKENMSGNKGMTAIELAKKLDLSRQVVSHYLTRLMEEGLVLKTNTRPVYWYPVVDEDLEFFGAMEPVYGEADKPAPVHEEKTGTVFSALVGHLGSQKKIVEMCKAAVDYPPAGLPMLITGESGVGKSFIARLIYQYALEQGVLEPDAPFVVLNCADYANNPELLSATLLGYKKGSFTGAHADKEGLLKEADKGYLFLDEVHRLNFENQEKLFLFMDSGTYRPLGEKGWKKSQVRLIFATTENPEEVLLETFRRRITLQVPIPSMMERPLGERIQMLYLFYQQESRKIGRPIQVHPDLVKYLCFYKIEGNIGKLENLVQVSCANAFFRQKDENKIIITRDNLTVLTGEKGLPEIQLTDWLVVEPRDGTWRDKEGGYRLPVNEFTSLWQDIAALRAGRMDELADSVYLNFKRICRSLNRTRETKRLQEAGNLFINICDTILSRYGISGIPGLSTELAFFYDYGRTMEVNPDLCQALNAFFEETMPKAFYIAARLVEKFSDCDYQEYWHLSYLFTLVLREYVTEGMDLHGLIVAHGDSTASSIQKVANQTCKTFVFEAIDMPMDTTIEDTIAKVHQYLEQVNPRKGMILLIDTGSLHQMYSSIKNYLSGDLLIINNVSTAIALDIGIKMLGRCSFLDIVKGARDSYSFDIQYFEGISRGRNIIVSCMSGVGIAEKLQEAMCKVIDTSVVDIVTIEYQELKKLLENNGEAYFGQTLLILTTSPLPEAVKVPWLNIYDILDGKGERILWNGMKGLVTREKFEELKTEYIRFFSIEGIVSRLRFLNPAVIINEVELILMKYEQSYELEMTGHIRLNLYMHIAFMIERLMTSNPREDQQGRTLTLKEERFNQISRQVFKDVETKYRIHVDSYELSLLYELFRRIIREK